MVTLALGITLSKIPEIRGKNKFGNYKIDKNTNLSQVVLIEEENTNLGWFKIKNVDKKSLS